LALEETRTNWRISTTVEYLKLAAGAVSGEHRGVT
jgi:hypothetical protein